MRAVQRPDAHNMRPAALTILLTLLLAAPAHGGEPAHQAAPYDRAGSTVVFGKVERRYHWLLTHASVTSYSINRCGPIRCVSLVAYGEGYGDYIMATEACRVKGVKVACRARRSSEYLTPQP